MPDFTTWHSHGKLLLTGEYLVLEGAKALAIPVNKGQNLKISAKSAGDSPTLEWKAKQLNDFWFRATFSLPELKITDTTNTDLASTLQKLLQACQAMSPGFLDGSESIVAETNLEFNKEFGLGSSSTLVSNLAYWADIDPFLLQRTVLGGSGYDIACARSTSPLFYQLVNGEPVTEEINLSFPFTKHLYFVYLGHKQRTTESIEVFKQKARFSQSVKDRISEISIALPKVQELNEFERLLDEHEKIISAVLGILPVKQRIFPDHKGAVKSLGAWGGDFILMTSKEPENTFRNYLYNKGFNTVYSWDDLILR